MAYQKLTLADCKVSMADRLTNATVPVASATLTFWTRLLNRAVLYCADILRISKQTMLTTVNGTIALPDEFLIMYEVTNSGNVPLTQVDQDNLGSHVGLTYWISGDQYNGFFLNTPIDGTWTVSYAYRPTPMVNDTDKCIIPDIEAVVAMAVSLVRKTQSDPFEDADALMAECDARIKEMSSAQNINESLNLSWE